MPSIAAKVYIHVVAAVIHDPKNPRKIFLAQRKPGQHLEHKWEFPGGKLEPGEPRFQGLRREIEEETGILIRAAHPLITLRHSYPDKHILLDTWRVTRFSGRPHSREGQRIAWVEIDQLGQFDMPAADAPIVEALGLPAEILITPDVDREHIDSFVEQFTRVMQKHPYQLVSFRAHGLDDESYADLAGRLQSIARPLGGGIIIHRNSSEALANSALAQFHNWHLNSRMLHEVALDRPDQGIHWSASCHNVSDLRRAASIGCRFAYLSSVRATFSHPGLAAKGWWEFSKMVKMARIPVYALGGINRNDLTAARYQGASGVAGIRDFWSA